MIVNLAQDIPAFIMYCVYEEYCSSLFIESTDSMIHYESKIMIVYIIQESCNLQ